MTKKDGFESLSDHGVTVVIDKNLTPELIEEGNVREIISKIQTMRKDSGFEVMDNIRISFSGNPQVESIATRNSEEIKSETLGVELTVGAQLKHSKEWNINGENVTISVEKV
jgi:isoleucyl-tRNA synthetase